MPNFVDENEIEALLRQLRVLKRELDDEVTKLGGGQMAVPLDSAFDISSTAQFDDYQQRIQMVEAALRKIENESYGVCEVCQGAISLSDLKRQPDCLLCSQCELNC